MATKHVLSVIMALLVCILFNTPVFAQSGAYTSLVDSTKIENPSVLADAIERSLSLDMQGNDMTPDGMNTTPNGFLAAFKAAGGNVANVYDLPRYLRSLVACDIPSSMHLSRVRKSNGEVDTTVGLTRGPMADEMGWCEPSSGDEPPKFVYAGSCGNTPIAMTIRLSTGALQTRRLPFPTSSACGLEDGERYLAFRQYESEAAQNACVQKFGMPRDGHLGEKTDGAARPEDFGAYGDTFSTQCGPELHKNYSLGTKAVEVTVYAISSSTSEEMEAIFHGTLTGERLAGSTDLFQGRVESNGLALRIPAHISNSAFIVAEYKDGVLAPTVSGNGEEFSRFRRVDHAANVCPANTFSSVEAP